MPEAIIPDLGLGYSHTKAVPRDAGIQDTCRELAMPSTPSAKGATVSTGTIQRWAMKAVMKVAMPRHAKELLLE